MACFAAEVLDKVTLIANTVDEGDKQIEVTDVLEHNTPEQIKDALLAQGVTALIDRLKPNSGDRVLDGQRLYNLQTFNFVSTRTYPAVSPGNDAATGSPEPIGESRREPI